LACASKHRSRFAIAIRSGAIAGPQTVSLASLSMPVLRASVAMNCD
jgi:hypothetical protein